MANKSDIDKYIERDGVDGWPDPQYIAELMLETIRAKVRHMDVRIEYARLNIADYEIAFRFITDDGAHNFVEGVNSLDVFRLTDEERIAMWAESCAWGASRHIMSYYMREGE